MKVNQTLLSKLRPYPNNPRKNAAAVDKVAKSIESFGWRQPIVVDSDGVIVVGHTRYLAALKLGLKRGPVHVAADLTPEQARAYRLMDNRSNEDAAWDPDLLAEEIAALAEGGQPLTLTGFDAEELEKLAASIDSSVAEDLDAAVAVGESFGAGTDLPRSSAPFRYWSKNGYLLGDVLDFGSGQEEHGFPKYDPFTRPDPTPLLMDWDVIMCNYVLNVQPSDHLIVQILALLSRMLRPSGMALVAVVTDANLGGTPACGSRPAKAAPEWAALLGSVFAAAPASAAGFTGFVCTQRGRG